MALPGDIKNVFRGPRSLHDFYDPDKNVATPLVEIPSSLNPFYQDGVRIFAKLHSDLPAKNVKSLPALNMLRQAGLDAGLSSDSKGEQPSVSNIVEYSSGSTVISLAIIANIFGLDGVTAYLSNKTSKAKLDLMRFFGLKLRVFGGPSQPEPADVRGGICAAAEHGKKDGWYNPNQYENEANWQAHAQWTATQLDRQLGHELDILVAGMGTSGTMTGTGLAIKKLQPHVHRVGVTTQPGDRVPGPRSEALLAPVTFPWRDSIDAMEWVGSRDAYTLSLKLCRHGLLVGPSSGFNLQGLLQHLGRHKEEGRLDSLRHPTRGDGFINAVFICCDGPYQYIDEYWNKVDGSEFKPIDDDILLDVDTHRYDDAWELDAAHAISRFGLVKSDHELGTGSDAHERERADELSEVAIHAGDSLVSVTPSLSSRSTSLGSIFDSVTDASSISSDSHSSRPDAVPIFIDLRDQRDCQALALGHPIFSVPLDSLSAHQDCPFSDARVLRAQWLELKPLFSKEHEGLPVDLRAHLAGSDVAELDLVFLCHTGSTSRIATSIARDAGYSAWSIAGGVESLVTAM